MYINKQYKRQHFFCFTLILFASIVSYTNTKRIQLPIINDRNIELYENSNNSLLFQINIEELISGKQRINSNLEPIGYDTKNHRLYQISDNYLIDMNNNKINFLFTCIEDRNMISFPHRTPNLNYSFIHQIYNNNYINKLSFAIEINKNQTQQYLYLGDIPRQNKKKYKNIVKVNAAKNATEFGREYWGFNISGFQLGDELLIANDKIIFLSLSHESMVTSKKIYEWIKNKVLTKFLKEGKCNENDNGWSLINCESSVFAELPNLYIVLSEKPYKAIPMKLRECENKHEFNIAYNPAIDNLAYMFINRNLFFDKIVEFDYDTDVITFYSEYPADVQRMITIKQWIFVSFGIICCLNMVYLIYVILMNKK
jgi:hypothetical protein